jgi:putative sterol carrier protein
MTRPSDLVARGFARTVAQSPEKRLRQFVSGWRRPLVLGAIFRQMPRRFNREQAKDVDAVIDWKLKGGRDDGVDRYQVTIKDGRCRVTRRPTEEPRATLELDAVDFLRLAGGVAAGPELFMSGKLKVEGDLMFTARLPARFRVPVPQ